MKLHNFSELEAQISPERRARIDEEVKKALAEMPITRRSHIQAMGGDLEVVARFPDGDVTINKFSQPERYS